MTRNLLALLAALWCGFVSAAPVAYSFRGINVTRVDGVTHLRGTSPGGFDAGGASVGAQTVASFGSVTLPYKVAEFAAASPIAATAAAAAVTAVRLNPAGLVTSAVASYLLTKGLEYANGSFNKLTTVLTVPTGMPTTNYCANYNNAYYGYSYTTNWTQASATLCRATCAGTGPSNGAVYGNYACTLSCPAGQTLVNGQCSADAKIAPTESDWDAARVGYWPDAANRDLIRNGVPLPTDKSVFNPVSKDVPIGDPYVDPVTGKRYQDTARVTPSPTTPEVADVQMFKQEVDATGAPVVNSGTGQPVPPVEDTDWCKKNPDASGCKPLDEVPDVELQEDTITLSISPVSGFGPETGTCPADRTLFSKGGSPIVWSWGQYCTFASGIRPLIVGFAWISALMIVVGVARRNS
jgi:hypothetical protein